MIGWERIQGGKANLNKMQRFELLSVNVETPITSYGCQAGGSSRVLEQCTEKALSKPEIVRTIWDRP